MSEQGYTDGGRNLEYEGLFDGETEQEREIRLLRARRTMKREDLMNLPGNNNPVLCADGQLGMLLIFSSEDDMCGVQVHGEELHRWIPAADLTASEGGALKQAGAPAMPPASAQADMVQMMLAMDWAERGGPFIGA